MLLLGQVIYTYISVLYNGFSFKCVRTLRYLNSLTHGIVQPVDEDIKALWCIHSMSNANTGRFLNSIGRKFLIKVVINKVDKVEKLKKSCN